MKCIKCQQKKRCEDCGEVIQDIGNITTLKMPMIDNYDYKFIPEYTDCIISKNMTCVCGEFHAI